MRKFLTWTALIGVILSALLGILMIFSVIKFGDYKNYFFSLITIAIGFSFALSSYNLYYNTRNILSLISIVFIILSIILVIISIFLESSLTDFVNITVSISSFSILFSIIVSNITKLGSKYCILQIIVYLIALYILGVIILELWEIWSGFNTIFWVFVILGFSGLISLGVLSKKEGNDILNNSDNQYITIKKDEYEYLLSRSQLLDEILEERKSKL